MLADLANLLLGYKKPRLEINIEPLPISDFPMPEALSFSLRAPAGPDMRPLVDQGEEVSTGQFLAHDGAGETLPSPVKGKVLGVIVAPDLRGAKTGRAIMIEPSGDSSAKAFDGLDPEKEQLEKIWERIRRAGVLTNSLVPRPLSRLIGPEAGVSIQTLIMLAADREPEVRSSMQLFRERSGDAIHAAAMLSRITGPDKTLLAVPKPLSSEASNKTGGTGVEVLPVPPAYPDSLEQMVAMRSGGAARVVALETALAAFYAVRDGKVQDRKVVTYISGAGRARRNLNVPLGTRLKDVFQYLNLYPGDRDKVVAGGPMRGYAQYSLETAVDQGVDAIMLAPHESQVAWSHEPCVNCGACVDVCPVNLQPHLLGRYAEYGMFDRAEDMGVESCIECGLCAWACTGRRPLMQWLRLAKREVQKNRAARQTESEREEQEEQEPGTEGSEASTGQQVSGSG